MSNIFHSLLWPLQWVWAEFQSKDHLEMLGTCHARQEVCHWATLSLHILGKPWEIKFPEFIHGSSVTLAFKNEVSPLRRFLDSQFVRNFILLFACQVCLLAWECWCSKFKRCQTACCVFYFLTASYKPEVGKIIIFKSSPLVWEDLAFEVCNRS